MSISENQRAVADCLFGLSSGVFSNEPTATKDYIVFEEKVTNPTRKKNAVSVLANRVSFMVSDWSDEGEAKILGLNSRRNEQMKRLQFPRLTVLDIQNHSTFFQTLLRNAQQASRNKQVSQWQM